MTNIESPVDHQTENGPPEGLYQSDCTVNKRVPTIKDVTEEDLGFFNEYGYLVIDEFLDDVEIKAALDGMMSLLGEAGSPESSLPDNVIEFTDGGGGNEIPDPGTAPPELAQDYVRKFWKFSDHSDGMRGPSEKSELLDLLSILVDSAPKMFQDMALIKPPRRGGEKPWHQDKAYFDLDLDAPVVGVWIALDEATPENGCMHIIPGSHNDGPVVHFSRRDWQICDTDVQVDQNVMVPLEAGGALLFDGLLHHGTPPNNSDSRRRALQFHYTASDAAWVEERPKEFGNSNKDVEC